MCKSKAQGGGRCHAHTKQGYESARDQRANVQGDPQASISAAERAKTRYVEKVGEYAAYPDPRAHAALTQRLFALDTGATPAGDDSEVIRAALAANPAPKPKPTAKQAKGDTTPVVDREVQAARETRRQELQRAMRTGTPAVDTPQSRRPAVPRDTSVLGGLLQSGGLRAIAADDRRAVAEHGVTRAYGYVRVPASQRGWVEPWGPGVPVKVDVVADVPYSNPDAPVATNAGFLRRLFGQQPPVTTVAVSKWLTQTPAGFTTVTENREHDHPDYRHGTLATENTITGELRYYRAIEKNGDWEIQHPIT